MLKIKSCVPPYRPRLKWETQKTMWPRSGIQKSDGGNIDSQNDQLIFHSHAHTFVHVNSVNNCFRLERIIFSAPLNPRDILQNFGLLLVRPELKPIFLFLNPHFKCRIHAFPHQNLKNYPWRPPLNHPVFTEKSGLRFPWNLKIQKLWVFEVRVEKKKNRL